MMIFLLFCLLAVADWLALYKGWRKINYFTKPGAMLALLAWAFAQPNAWHERQILFTIGLFFSLLGDIFLLLPPRLFAGGLAAFLWTHIFYTAGFNLGGWSPIKTPLILWPAAVLVFAGGLWVCRQVQKGTLRRMSGKLRRGVLAYSLVVSLMFASALLTLGRPGWPITTAVLATVGAGLFYLSDGMLAWDRFIRPFPRAQLWVRITYHVGQALVLLGIGWFL